MKPIIYHYWFQIKTNISKWVFLYGDAVSWNLEFISNKKNKIPIKVSLELVRNMWAGQQVLGSMILYEKQEEYFIDLDASQSRIIDFDIQIPKISQFPTHIQKILHQKLKTIKILWYNESLYHKDISWRVSVSVKKFYFWTYYLKSNIVVCNTNQQQKNISKYTLDQMNNTISFWRYMKLFFIAVVSFTIIMIVWIYYLNSL